MLIDGPKWCGLLWSFYQVSGLSFWRHPFTAEDPLLVSKWYNATFFSKSVMMKKQTHIHLGWPEDEFQQIFISGWTVPLSVSSFVLQAIESFLVQSKYITPACKCMMKQTHCIPKTTENLLLFVFPFFHILILICNYVWIIQTNKSEMSIIPIIHRFIYLII